MFKKIGAVLLAALSKPAVQNKLIALLKVKIVENLLVSVLKLSGFKLWLMTLLADRLIEKTDQYIVEPIFREIGYQGDVLAGATVFIRVEDAKDIKEWLAAVYDV